jgi:hypothetical protein
MSAYTVSLLDITSPGGIVRHRWQARWPGQAVTWEGAAWEWVPWQGDSLVAGSVSGAGASGLTFPLLPTTTLEPLTAAAADGCTARLRVYHYAEELDTGSGFPATTADVILVGTISGLLGLRSITPTQIVAEISAQRAVAQGWFPPRLADTATIGIPCELGDGR